MDFNSSSGQPPPQRPSYGSGYGGSYYQRGGSGSYGRGGGYSPPNAPPTGNTYYARSYNGTPSGFNGPRGYSSCGSYNGGAGSAYGGNSKSQYYSSRNSSMDSGYVSRTPSAVGARSYTRPSLPPQHQDVSPIPDMPPDQPVEFEYEPMTAKPYKQPVKNIGFMAPPKRFSSNVAVDPLDSDEPVAMLPPNSRQVTPAQSPCPERILNDAPQQSSGPSGPFLDESIQRLVQVKCDRIEEQEEVATVDRLTYVRRRAFQITWYNMDMAKMRDVVHRMSTIYADDGKRTLIVTYAIFQQEVCSTGREHWQMYIEFERPMSIAWVKRELFQDNGVHVTMRLQSRDTCREYCAKARTRKQGPANEVGPFEFGVWRKQGKTGEKMQEIQQAITDGRNLVDIAEDDGQFATVVRNHRNLEWFEEQFKMRQAMKERREVTVRLFYGPTGTGKTHLAQEEAIKYCNGKREDVFILDTSGQSKQQGVKVWFDGYKYGQVLIIDEYNGWIDTEYLLRILDKNPIRLNVKFGTKWAFWREVWITTNIPPQEWTECGRKIDDRHMEAILRRIDWIVFIPERGKYVIEKQPHEPVDLNLPTVEPYVLDTVDDRANAPPSIYHEPSAAELYSMACQFGSQSENNSQPEAPPPSLLSVDKRERDVDEEIKDEVNQTS